MPRVSTAKIVEWGTPPEPQPTGWDAVRIELDSKPGEWANVGEFTSASARKIASERVPNSDGYESRIAPGKTDGRVNLWVRKLAADDAGTVETTEAKLDEKVAQIGASKRAGKPDAA